MPGKDTPELDPMAADFLDEGAGDGETAGADAQDALVDKLAGDAGADGEGDDQGDDTEVEAEGAGETDGGDGEGDGEGDEGGQPQAAADAPAPWSKPLQNVQQEMGNARREIKETRSMLQQILDKLSANPTAANNAAAEKIEQRQDALAEIEKELGDDPTAFERTPGLLKKLVGEVRQVREENKALKADLQGERTKASAVEAGWKKWAAENPTVGLKRGKALWDEALTDALAVDGDLQGAQLQGAAKVLWAQKLKAEKDRKPSATITPGKNPPRSGGKIAPTEGRGAGQVQTTQTLEQQVAAGKFGLDRAFR